MFSCKALETRGKAFIIYVSHLRSLRTLTTTRGFVFDNITFKYTIMLSSTKVNLLCLSVLHLLLCHLSTKNLNVSSILNNGFEIATDKSCYCHLLFIWEKVTEGRIFLQTFHWSFFILENPKHSRKAKKPNNSHRHIKATTKESNVCAYTIVLLPCYFKISSLP